MEAAVARAAAFDFGRAAEMFAAAARSGCAEGDVPAHYLRGLTAARAAFAQGGSPESLEPVREAIAEIETLGGGLPGSAEVARFVLMAAAAAAQSEHDEMALLIDHAIRLERLQFAAAEPGAPVVTAHEVAGDLWLQAHRYEEAQAAYRRAAAQVGRTPRIIAGLARSASRLKDVTAACRESRALLDWWGAKEQDPDEIREARKLLQQPACAVPN
jgi:tetratricopeptide (TPR) repeat protein